MEYTNTMVFITNKTTYYDLKSIHLAVVPSRSRCLPSLGCWISSSRSRDGRFLVGLEHEWIMFHKKGMSSFPLTNSYFSRWLKHVETTSFGLTLALFSERIHQYTSDVEVVWISWSCWSSKHEHAQQFPNSNLSKAQTISDHLGANFASAGQCCSQAHREPFLLGRVTSASGQGHCQFSTGGWFPHVSTLSRYCCSWWGDLSIMHGWHMLTSLYLIYWYIINWAVENTTRLIKTISRL